jgi:hypothetical protein
MKIDSNRTENLLNVHFIIVALVSLILLAPSISHAQTTPSNQSAAASSSANITAAEGPGSVLKLSQANVALDIPLMRGYENGHEIFFIATDASDNQTGFKVNVAPVLAKTPESARNQVYGFTNGIPGDGPFGFQLPVVATKPGDQGYSPLWQLNPVEWNQDFNPQEIKSVQEIMSAQHGLS